MALPNEHTELEYSMGTIPSTSKIQGGCINDMMVCTYEESHVVAGGKYHAHVMACRKDPRRNGYMENEMEICPYIAAHHVHNSVVEKHVLICPGFYQYCMMQQEEPLSMIETDDDDADTIKNNQDEAEDKEESEWDEDEYSIPISGYKLTDMHGTVYTPQTKGDFSEILDGISKQIAKHVLHQMSEDVLQSKMNLMQLSDDVAPVPEEALENALGEPSKLAIKEYEKETQILKNVAMRRNLSRISHK